MLTNDMFPLVMFFMTAKEFSSDQVKMLTRPKFSLMLYAKTFPTFSFKKFQLPQDITYFICLSMKNSTPNIEKSFAYFDADELKMFKLFVGVFV